MLLLHPNFLSFGTGDGEEVFLLVLFLNSKNPAFKRTSTKQGQTEFSDDLIVHSAAKTVRTAKRSAVSSSSHCSHWELLGAQLPQQKISESLKDGCMTGSSGSLALGTYQAFKSVPTQNEGAEYFPHQTDTKAEI